MVIIHAGCNSTKHISQHRPFTTSDTIIPANSWDDTMCGCAIGRPVICRAACHCVVVHKVAACVWFAACLLSVGRSCLLSVAPCHICYAGCFGGWQIRFLHDWHRRALCVRTLLTAARWACCMCHRCVPCVPPVVVLYCAASGCFVLWPKARSVKLVNASTTVLSILHN